MGKLNSAFAAFLNAFGSKKPASQSTVAVIVAGGSSTRMGEGLSKQWLTVGGLPVIVHTLLAFERAKTIREIVLVIKQDEQERYVGIAEQYGIRKPLSIVTGGETRQQSAKNGFLACADRADFVAIHDGARCLITPEEIDHVCRAAYRWEAATAATRAADTVKIADKFLFISSTPERAYVWQAQTPQVFKTSLYRTAAYVCRDEGVSVTDDNQMCEHIKIPVRLVECSKENIKITQQTDLLFAEAILKARAAEQLKKLAPDTEDKS